MKKIKFLDKNISNTHEMKNMMNVLREPRKRNSHHRLDTTKQESQKDYKSYKDQ